MHHCPSSSQAFMNAVEDLERTKKDIHDSLVRVAALVVAIGGQMASLWCDAFDPKVRPIRLKPHPCHLITALNHL